MPSRSSERSSGRAVLQGMSKRSIAPFVELQRSGACPASRRRSMASRSSRSCISLQLRLPCGASSSPSKCQNLIAKRSTAVACDGLASGCLIRVASCLPRRRKGISIPAGRLQGLLNLTEFVYGCLFRGSLWETKRIGCKNTRTPSRKSRS